MLKINIKKIIGEILVVWNFENRKFTENIPFIVTFEVDGLESNCKIELKLYYFNVKVTVK